MKRVMVLMFLSAVMMGLIGFLITPRHISADTPARFWMSDWTRLGDDGVAYLLHDNRRQEVCFIVVESYRGGVTMTPRSCQ